MDLAEIRLASPYAANAVLLWATGEPCAPLPVFAPFLATRSIGEFGTEALSPNVDRTSHPVFFFCLTKPFVWVGLGLVLTFMLDWYWF